MREMSSLIYNASEDQIVRARNQLKASILFSQDGPGGACSCASSPQIRLTTGPLVTPLPGSSSPLGRPTADYPSWVALSCS